MIETDLQLRITMVAIYKFKKAAKEIQEVLDDPDIDKNQFLLVPVQLGAVNSLVSDLSDQVDNYIEMKANKEET